MNDLACRDPVDALLIQRTNPWLRHRSLHCFGVPPTILLRGKSEDLHIASYLSCVVFKMLSSSHSPFTHARNKPQCRRSATVFAPALRHRTPPPAARPPAHLTHLTRAPHARAQGEHLLHVLNTISSRKLVLEAELKEIDEDIASNESMSRKYGAEFFTEGAARLAQSRVRACESLFCVAAS